MLKTAHAMTDVLIKINGLIPHEETKEKQYYQLVNFCLVERLQKSVVVT